MRAENCQPNLPTMLNTSRKALKSCKVKYAKTNLTITIKVGDDILLKAPDGDGPYVANVTEITSDRRGRNVRIGGRWYYRPEDTKKGRRNFHGSKELFRSNHVDFQTPDSIEGKCKVHSFKEYVELGEVEDTDYYCRMDYDPETERYTPERIEVFCICNLPWNPDLMMVKCDDCAGWHHPECLGLTREEAERMDRVICDTCQALDEMLQRHTSDLGDEQTNKRARTGDDSPSSSEIPDVPAAVPKEVFPDSDDQGLPDM